MSAGARLAAFGALVAAVFAAAVLAGGAAGSGSDKRPARAATAPVHGGHGGGEKEAAPEAAVLRGLAVADRGLRLELLDRALPRGRRARLRFRIARENGDPVTRFEVEHEKRMHLIVVRRDQRGFQHLHPEMAPDGTWSTDVVLAEPGAYRVFADFTVAGQTRTLASDLTVDGAARYAALPAASPSARTDGGHEVRLDGAAPSAGRPAELAFSVFKDGEPVHTEPYLGAGGHLVALRDGDLAYLHTHPAGHGDEAGHDDAVTFESAFPSRGRYRLFFQFKSAGRVHTAEFTQEVTR